MTNLFISIRFVAFACCFAASGVVLGISAWFATIFLPNLHRDFIIYSLVVSTFTIIVLTLLLLRSQPRVDIFFLFLLAVLWLSEGAYTADVIGHVECSTLENQSTPTKDGTIASDVYCREMKAILAFSWANFVMLAISFATLIALTIRVYSKGVREIWRDSISDLPWFNQWVHDGRHYPVIHPQPAYNYHGGSGGASYVGGGNYVVQPVPGHTAVIQSSPHGGPPNVNYVPA